ncbi:MAG TPA: VOC family protein [Polyangiaceae bacterium]|jgi:catechol 2,3-dioxygenase-like lactoylglutathione lyase family enzyme
MERAAQRIRFAADVALASLGTTQLKPDTLGGRNSALLCYVGAHMAQTDDWRIDHTGIGVSDIMRSGRFYEASLGALGLQPCVRITTTGSVATDGDDIGGVGYGATFPIFWIDIFHPPGARQHIAFRGRSREEVDAFHAAATATGGQDNGPPGPRGGGYPRGYYAAFVIDPDGNNIEAVFREEG